MTIRIKESTTYEDGKQYVELALTSDDTKPTDGIATGSTAMEADTGDTYMYDEDAQTWSKI